MIPAAIHVAAVAAIREDLLPKLGGLEQALAAAAELGGVGAEVGLEVYPGEPTIKDILGSFDQLVAMRAGARADGLPAGLGLIVDELAANVGPEADAWLGALRATLRTTVTLQGSSVWAVEWIQPAR